MDTKRTKTDHNSLLWAFSSGELKPNFALPNSADPDEMPLS